MRKCTCCGDEAESLTVICDDLEVCDFCLDNVFEHCDECGEYYDFSSVDFIETEDGRMICEYCAEDMDL